MIRINRIRTHKSLDFLSGHHDVFFHGEALDERTNMALEKITAKKIYKIKFQRELYSLVLDIGIYNVKVFKEFMQNIGCKNIIIDSTSLDFPEILYILSAVNNSNCIENVTILYIEPKEYSKIISADAGDEEYTLSDTRQPFSSLPMFSSNTLSPGIQKSCLISFLGFESNRLGQIIINDDHASFKKLLACISVPAYIPGWENKSLRKNISHFDHITTKLVPYPGSNPYAVYQTLLELYAENPRLVVTSLGTKPTALGICIFLINHHHENTVDKQIGAIYDYPVKSANRTRGIGEIYSYELKIG